MKSLAKVSEGIGDGNFAVLANKIEAHDEFNIVFGLIRDEIYANHKNHFVRKAFYVQRRSEYIGMLINMVKFAVDYVSEHALDVMSIGRRHYVALPRRRHAFEEATLRFRQDIADKIAGELQAFGDDVSVLAISQIIIDMLPGPEEMVALFQEKGEVRAGLNASHNKGESFESECKAVLVDNGFCVRNTSSSSDQGGDLVAEKDGIRYIVQCKNWSNSIGNSAVQEVVSARSFYQADYAVVVGRSSFTPSARELAAKTEVLLINENGLKDIDRICSAMKI